MAKMTRGQKSGRVLQFLGAVSKPRAASALVAHGFSQKDLDEGWRLLRELCGSQLNTTFPKPKDPSLIDRLDDWENKWFPIASATLNRHYPEIHEAIFLNLSQTTGIEVALSVGTFLERLAALEQGKLPNGKQARKLLVQRGLSAETVQEAKRLIEQIGSIQEQPTIVGRSKEEEQAAEDAMWSWYLEWAQIARIAIHDRRVLRSLGFLQSQSRPSPETDAKEEADEALAEQGLE